MLGVGIFGAGRVSGGHALAAERIEGLRLVAVAEPNEERRRRFMEQHGCDGYAHHQDLLARDDIDLILVGLPHWLHAPLTLDALNAGKHVLVEKPMAITVEECDAMIEAADRNGVQLMVGHTQQFFGANVAAKERLDRGEIGEIVLATETWFKSYAIAERPPWFLDRDKGGGMWLMNGAHMVDLLLWFIGSDVVAVKGMVTNKVMGQKSDDSAAALLEFRNGVYATLAHTGKKRPERMVGPDWFTGEIVGTEGILKTIPYQNRAWIQKEGTYEPIPVPARGGILDEVSAFVASIRAGTEPPISNAHSRAVVEVLLAVEESSRIGREVRLD